MGLFGLFRRKHNHPDPKVRLQAVGQLNDRHILTALARHDAEERVRWVATLKLDEQTMFAERAQRNTKWVIKEAAESGNHALNGRVPKLIADTVHRDDIPSCRRNVLP